MTTANDVLQMVTDNDVKFVGFRFTDTPRQRAERHDPRRSAD